MRKDTRQQLEESVKPVHAFAKNRFVDVMPETIETAVCEYHGEFSFKYADPLFGKILVHSVCTKCISDRNDFIDAEVLRIDAKEKEEKLVNIILARGVSKRNLYKTFDTYIAKTPEQAKAKALYQAFSKSVCNGYPVSNLIACGSVGTGKTHLASSAINEMTRARKDCEIIKIIDLIREFKNTWSHDNDETEEKFINYYTNIDALIIDEVGVQFGSDTEKMIIFDIIDGRYNNMLPTILISNLPLMDVKELIGDRAIDRLREDGGDVVAMQWPSHRGNA